MRVFLTLLILAAPLFAVDLEEARNLLVTGKYAEVVKAANDAMGGVGGAGGGG